MLTSLLQDLAYSLRVLLKRPGFAIPVLLTFTLGIGLNTAIFSIVHAVLLSPLPYDDAGRLVMVWEKDNLRGTEEEGLSMPDFEDLKAQQQVFEAMAAYRGAEELLASSENTPERVIVGEVSNDFFSVFRTPPALGRTFVAADAQANSDRVIVLSDPFWRQRFGGTADALGKTLRLADVDYQIVGVLPSSFVSPTGRQEIGWRPLRVPANGGNRGRHELQAFARLRPGVSLENAQKDQQAIMSRLEREYPQSNKGRGAWVISLYEEIVGEVRTSLLLLFAAVGSVFLIAAVNATNLLLAHFLERQNEVALRTALGSTRARLVRQHVAETFILALSGGAAGLLLANWGIRVFVALGPSNVPRLESIGIDRTVFGFSLLLTLTAAILCSVLPALHAARLDPQLLLKGGRTASTGRQFLRRLLVVTEIALAMVLVIQAGLITKSFFRLLAVDLGLQPQHVLTLDVSLPRVRYPFPPFTVYPQWPELATLNRQMLEKVRTVPGVEGVGIALNNALDEGWTTQITFDGRPAPAEGEAEEVRIRPVAPGYLETVGAKLVRGRTLNEQDNAESPAVILVNEAFVRRYFNDDPIGQRISWWRTSREIVGIVKDVRFMGLGEDVPPAVYPPFQQLPDSSFNIAVRTSVEPASVLPAVRSAIWSVESDAAVYNAEPLADAVSESIAQPRLNMVLFLFFAGLAIVLAAVGLYGLMAYSVAQRTAEIGIRLALGAERRDILRLVVTDGLMLLSMGLAIGAFLSLATGRFLSSVLFEVSTLDPLVFVGVMLLLAVVGMLALWVPLLAATRVDPLIALKYE